MTKEPIGAAEEAGAPGRLFRSRTDRVWAGVCGGIAEYLGTDPTLIRLGTAVVAVGTGFLPMLILYIIAAIVIPERPRGVAPAAAARNGITVPRGQGPLILGLVLVGIGVLGFANEILRIDWDLLWPIGLIAFGASIVFAAMTRR